MGLRISDCELRIEKVCGSFRNPQFTIRNGDE